MATFQGLFSFLANLLAGQLVPHAPTLSLLLCPVSFMSGHLVGSLQIEYPGRSARRSRWLRGQATGLFITYGLMPGKIDYSGLLRIGLYLPVLAVPTCPSVPPCPAPPLLLIPRFKDA